MTSIPRKAMAIALAVAIPMLVLLEPAHRSAAGRLVPFAWAIAAAAAAGLFARPLSKRLKRASEFVDRMRDPVNLGPLLPAGEDEMGELERSLAQTAEVLGENVKRLGLELAGREAILGGMTEAVVATDEKLNITFWNRSFQEIAGEQEIAGGVPLIRVVRDPGLLQILKRVVDSNEPVRQRLNLSAREEQFFDVQATPFLAGASRGAIAILHDVTPAERLERTKRDFIANVSHEIRTPLAAIGGYAETLLDGGLDDEQLRRKFVENIQANIVRLNHLAADLLTLSELESRRSRPEPAPIPVGEVIRGSLCAIEPIAKQNQVEVDVVSLSEVFVLGNRRGFEQAVMNLLDNAVKFNRVGGAVRVEVREGSGGNVDISVSDTGGAAEDLSRIFERFYRVDKARSRQVGGTGLGLSIVKHAIEQMNGTVTVESRLGEGSRFSILIPRYDSVRET